MSQLDLSNDQCDASNTTLDGDKEYVKFINENIVDNEDNVDIIDNVDIVDNEDNVGIVNNVDIGDDNNKSNNKDDAMIMAMLVMMELKHLTFQKA
ncbi:hypothetical protein Sjap_020195 [Stephania japonica]|uniref:Uncharacterized protein n=1 Tax=Stephania japonica TaxID=461633 RepID=A0AAP0F1M2_9MAGN